MRGRPGFLGVSADISSTAFSSLTRLGTCIASSFADAESEGKVSPSPRFRPGAIQIAEVDDRSVLQGAPVSPFTGSANLPAGLSKGKHVPFLFNNVFAVVPLIRYSLTLYCPPICTGGPLSLIALGFRQAA